jgi:four helix bundle protein
LTPPCVRGGGGKENSTMRRFEDLQVWQKARKLAQMVTAMTKGMRDDAGLADQMRRAAISIVSNICEGLARGTDPDIWRFFVMARGSAGELRGQLYLASDFGHISAEQFTEISDEAGQVNYMLNAFIERLR